MYRCRKPFAERTRSIKWRSTFPRMVRQNYGGRQGMVQVAEVQQITTDRIDLRIIAVKMTHRQLVVVDVVDVKTLCKQQWKQQ